MTNVPYHFDNPTHASTVVENQTPAGMPVKTEMTEAEEKELMEADGLEAVSAKSETPEMTGLDEAAMKFTQLVPYVSKLATAMPSKGGLVRVLAAVAEFPLGKAKPRLLSEPERQLFYIIQELQQYKSVVLQSFLKEQYEAEKLKKQATTELPVVEKENTNGGN